MPVHEVFVHHFRLLRRGEVTQGTSANTISEDTTVTGTAYTSTGDDENALRIDGASVTLDGVTVDKSAGATSNIWTLTGECTLTSLTNNGRINFNGYTITLADGTVLR